MKGLYENILLKPISYKKGMLADETDLASIQELFFDDVVPKLVYAHEMDSNEILIFKDGSYVKVSSQVLFFSKGYKASYNADKEDYLPTESDRIENLKHSKITLLTGFYIVNGVPDVFGEIRNIPALLKVCTLELKCNIKLSNT